MRREKVTAKTNMAVQTTNNVREEIREGIPPFVDIGFVLSPKAAIEQSPQLKQHIEKCAECRRDFQRVFEIMRYATAK